MSFRLQRTVNFSASHALSKFPEEHKCHRLHGHNYTVEVILIGKSLDDSDALLDFGVIDKLIRDRYDHQNLNDFPEFSDNPTCELVAYHIWTILDRNLFTSCKDDPPQAWVTCESVRVYESANAWVEYRP